MKIRPYRYGEDFEAVKSFGTDERTHALWSAGIFGYPLTRLVFEEKLKGLEQSSSDKPYIAEDGDGNAVGFFCLSDMNEEKEVTMKFVIISPSQRGRGCGCEMVRLGVLQAFEQGAEKVKMCVFSVNDKARRCYLAAGFEETSVAQGAFAYKGEMWGRCFLEIRR